MTFSEQKDYRVFRAYVPARAHLTLTATRSTDAAYIWVQANDIRDNGEWYHHDSVLSTGPDATYEHLFTEFPARAKGRWIDIGFRPDSTYTEKHLTVTPRLVFDAPATAITPGTPVTVSTTKPGQVAHLTFTGTTGQVIKVRTSGSTYPSYLWQNSYTLWLIRPDGTVVKDEDSGTVLTSSAPPVTLTASGTYTIDVDPTQDGTGSVVVELQDATSAR